MLLPVLLLLLPLHFVLLLPVVLLPLAFL